MTEENDCYLIFATSVIISLSIAILGFFAGEEIMENCGLKILSFIGLCVFSILYLLFIGICLFSLREETYTKKWSIYSNTPNNLERTEKLMFDARATQFDKPLKIECLKIVEIDTSKFKVNNNFFTKCQNIEEVTFFQRPKDFNSDTFSKNLALKKKSCWR